MISEEEVLELLNKQDAPNIICREFDLKPTRLARLIAAMANTSDGFIIIGAVKEAIGYNINGVSRTINFDNLINRAMKLLHCTPKIEYKLVNIKSRYIFTIKVYKSSNHIFWGNELYIINNNETVKVKGGSIMDKEDIKPTVFVSYSWDSETHKKWVKELSDKIHNFGITIILDQNDLVLGDSLPQFMEQSIANSDYVLIICTPTYKNKADARKGGVGYEESIITSDVLLNQNHRKYITILASSTWANSTPIWANGKYGVDLSSRPYSQDEFTKLIKTITLKITK